MMNQPAIILNHIVTHLEYDFLEVFFTTDKIKLEEACVLKLPEGLNKDKGIIINGRGPIWLYLILYRKIKEAKAAAWVAQFDPQLHGAALVESKDARNLLINKSEFEYYYPVPSKNTVIAFIGPPHSGKSVFLYTLFRQLLQKNPVYTNKNIFIIKGCPDGEGLWTYEIPPSLVQQIRYKNKFSQEFVNSVIQQIENTQKSKSIIFVDCGGKPDDFNRQILALCTHAILISSDAKKINVWKETYPGLRYVAIVHSYLSVNDKEKKNKITALENETFNMDMVDLERGNEAIVFPEAFLQYFLTLST